MPRTQPQQQIHLWVHQKHLSNNNLFVKNLSGCVIERAKDKVDNDDEERDETKDEEDNDEDEDDNEDDLIGDYNAGDYEEFEDGRGEGDEDDRIDDDHS